MRSCSLRSSAEDAPPLIVCGRPMRLALASLLAVGVLTLVLVPLGRAAGAWEGDRAIVQPTFAAGDVAPAQDAAYIGNYPNCRFGVGERHYPVVSYNVSSLNVGWYADWQTQTSPPQPGGAEYVQMLHVTTGGTYLPSGPTLEERIDANPGALWLIGNEPDCVHQDNVLPQEYAQAYHDAYTFIKGRDPTAKVSAGGIVQPTPLRMQYLDVVLDIYASLYGEPLPTDAWNIHSYILREVTQAAYPDTYWGADVPPGIAADHGMLYEIEDTDRLDIFQERLVQFRQWMQDRGYRDKPLIITEYGTLMPHSYQGWDEERGRVFMYGTFDFLLTANDPDLGYPTDENRLVQRWLWYSLDDTGYGGPLFDPVTQDILPMGTYFGAYTGAISPTVDLFAVDVGQVGLIPYSPTRTVTVTLRARVSNVGNVPITQPVAVRFLDDEGHQIGPDQVISETMAGCAEAWSVTATWPDVLPGAHVVRVVVDPEQEVSEGNESNNEVVGVVLVAKQRVFIPLVTRH